MKNQAATGGSNLNAGAPTTREEPEHTQEMYWPCSFCPKIFTCSQALGGHQNSHRQERDQWMKSFYSQHLSCRPRPALSIPPPLPPTPLFPPISGRGFHLGLQQGYPYGPSHGPAPGFGLGSINGLEPMLGTGLGLGSIPDTGYGGGPKPAPEFEDRYGPWLTLGLPGLEPEDRKRPKTNLGLRVGDGSGHGPVRGPNTAHLGQVGRMVDPTPSGGVEDEVSSDELDLELKL